MVIETYKTAVSPLSFFGGINEEHRHRSTDEGV